MPSDCNTVNFWNSRGWRTSITIIGFLLLLIGTLGVIFWSQVLDQIVIKEMILRPDSNVYNNWKIPPVELALDIYLFNWTNSKDFKNHSTKPILEQCGPYRFIETPDKVDIKWHPENASVSYRKMSYYHYHPEQSHGHLDDKIITLNAVALTGASKAKNWDSVRRKMVDVGLTMYSQELAITKTVDELLFSGYTDEMIDVARAVPIFGKDVEVPFDKFGWFYTRNGSADLTGVYTVFTGADNISKLGQMYSWNYKTNTGFYDSYCGRVNGSAGEFQPPRLTKQSVVQLFTPDLCRTITLHFKEEVNIEGIRGYKFIGDARSVDNGLLNPENKCFCGGECVQNGLINVTACRFGSPVFMSYPHFYEADEMYAKQVVGLEPNVHDHEFYIIVEPFLGTILEIAARFQVNMLVESIKNITLYEDVPRIFFPLIWFEQKVHISPKLAGNLRLLSLMDILGRICFAVLLSCGMIMICWYTLKKTCSHCWIKSKALNNSDSCNSGTVQCKTLDNVQDTLSSIHKTEAHSKPIKPLLIELNANLTSELPLEDQNKGSLL